MRLTEYESKKLLKEYGIKIPEGKLAKTSQDAVDNAIKIKGEVALKAQVLAGSRGLAGGIKFAADNQQVREKAEELFKTKIKGLKVEKILVEEKLEIKEEFYLSIMLDRTKKKPVLLGTIQGGVNIEKLSKNNPDMIVQQSINTIMGIENYHGLFLFSKFNIKNKIRKEIAQIITELYKIFKEKEATLVEINPLIITKDEKIIAADAKIMIDPAASYLKADTSPRYIPLKGDIGILANGAGLTMTTMDVVKELGGDPANFLEVGGEFYKKADEALNFLLDQKNELKGLIVNLFGAYARTDIITEQLIKVINDRDIKMPISFRIRGTGEKRARKMIKDELNQEVFLNLEDAVFDLLEST